MLWDLSTGERRRTIAHRGTAPALSNRPVFTHAGTALLTGDRDTVYVHDTASDTTRALPPPTAGTDSGPAPERASIDGLALVGRRNVLVSHWKQPPQLWRLDRPTHRSLRGVAGRLSQLPLITRDGRYAVTVCQLKSDHPSIVADPGLSVSHRLGVAALQCWDLGSGTLLWTKHSGSADGGTWPHQSWVSVLREGSLVTPTGFARTGTVALTFTDIASGVVLRQVPIAQGYARSPHELADGTLLFTDWDGEGSRLWRLERTADRPHLQLALPSGRLHPIPRCDLLLRFTDTRVYLHRLGDGTELATHQFPSIPALWEVSPNGGTLVVGDSDGGVHLLRLV